MDTSAWFEEVQSIPVWDTHTHLGETDTVTCRGVWDLMHYFWFRRELEAVGYPDAPGEMDERPRAEALADALAKARNTYWTRAVLRAARELWNAPVSDAASILELDRRIRATALRPGWPGEVLDRAGVARIVVGDATGSAAALGARAFAVPPIYDFPPQPRIDAILDSTQQKHEIEALASETEAQIAHLSDEGHRVIRVPFSFLRDEGTPTHIPSLKNYGNSTRTVRQYLSHVLYHGLEKHGFHVQLFVGMHAPDPDYRPRTHANRHHALAEARLIADMHDIFDMYSGCTFEIASAAPPQRAGHRERRAHLPQRLPRRPLVVRIPRGHLSRDHAGAYRGASGVPLDADRLRRAVG